jgi:hypothetical protein
MAEDMHWRMEVSMAEITAPQDVPDNTLVGWQPRERPRRLRDRWPLLLVLFAGLSMLCVGIPAALLLFYGDDNRAEWESAAHEFMCAMRDGEVENAFAMFAAGPEIGTVRSQLQYMTTSDQFVLFDGYQRLEMTTWNHRLGTGGDTVTLEGVVEYADGFEGTFNALLVRENSSWKVGSFYVWVPWEKIDAFDGAR